MRPEGPLVKYEDNSLWVENLNPEVKTKWGMSRWDMIKMGCMCVLAALGRIKME
jgi:hypothetical protein